MVSSSYTRVDTISRSKSEKNKKQKYAQRPSLAALLHPELRRTNHINPLCRHLMLSLGLSLCLSSPFIQSAKGN